MDKNAIKKFAVWARTELIARVSLKGVEYGITEDNIEDANADSVGDKVLTVDGYRFLVQIFRCLCFDLVGHKGLHYNAILFVLARQCFSQCIHKGFG